MFTCKLRASFIQRHLGVFFDSEVDRNPRALQINISPEQKDVDIAFKDIQEYKGNDKIVLLRLLGNLHEANEKLAKKNAVESSTTDAKITQLIATETDPEKKKILEELQAERNKKKTVLAQENVAHKKAIAISAMDKRAGLSESVKSRDNNPRQAQALLKGLEAIKGNTGVTALIEAIKQGEKKTSEDPSSNSRFNKLDLGSTNLRGLVDFALSGLDKDKYRSNGSYLGDSYAVNTFESIYKNNEAALKPIFKEIQAFYSAGQTTEDWLLARSKIKPGEASEAYQKSDFIRYLTTYREGTVYEFKKIDDTGTRQLESVDRSFFTPYPPGELEGYFGNMDDATLVARVKDLIKMGGGVTLATATPKELSHQLQSDPTLRANYIRGLNFVAMSPNRGEYFRTGKLEVGVNADTAKKLVEYLKDPKNLQDVRTGFEKSIVENKKAVAENTALNPDQKKNILAGIEKYTAEMNKDEVLRTAALDGMLTIANRGASIGGGATWNIDTFLADTASLGGSLASVYKGGIGAAISLAFTKELYHSNKVDFGVHYGLVAAGGKPNPFIGLHGSYEDALASVTKGPGFVNVFVGMRVGRNTDTIRDLEGLSSAQKEIYALAARNNPDQISIANLVPDKAIAARMDATIQSIIKMNGYKADLSQETAYAVLYPAVIEAMNQEVLLLRRESNDNGWVMKQIGINFGKIAGLTYVLPGFRVGKDDIVVQVNQKTEKVVVGKERAEIKSDTLFDKPIFKSGTKEYSLPLKDTSKIRSTSTTLPDGVSWDFDTSGNAIGIGGLKDYGIKVTLADGKYSVEYDAKKPVNVSQVVKGVDTGLDVKDLGRIKDIQEALANKVFRVNLSSLLAPWSKVRAQANKFSELLQNQDIEGAKKEFVDMTKGNKAFNIVSKYLSTETDPIKLQSALFDLRGGMMMDVSQANKLQNTGTDIVINENIADTKKRFDSMISNPKMTALLTSMGISSDDYAALIRSGGGAEKRLIMSSIQGGVLGAIGSLKTDTAFMARMPAGTMRFAQSGGQDLTLDITDGTKKTKVLDTIIPKDSSTEKAYRTALANALGIKGNEQLQKVSSANFTELMTTGKTAIDGKAVIMTEQKFMLCAYGDCTNPGVALKVGKIKTPDIPGSATVDISAVAESIITQEVVRNSTRVGTRSVSFGIAGGVVNDISAKVEPPSTTPDAPPVKPPAGPNTVPDAPATQGGAVTANPNAGRINVRPGTVASAPTPVAPVQAQATRPPELTGTLSSTLSQVGPLTAAQLATVEIVTP